MNTLRNQVQLIGHLGKKPEIINLENGNKLAKFTLATNENYKNVKGDRVENTQWHQLTAWGKTAEIAEMFLDKGKEIAITGKLTYNSYTDKEGIKRYKTDIIVKEILMFGK